MHNTNLNGEEIPARLRPGSDEMGNEQAGDVTAGNDGNILVPTTVRVRPRLPRKGEARRYRIGPASVVPSCGGF